MLPSRLPTCEGAAVIVTQLATQATGNSQDLRIKIFQAALAVTSWAATGDALFAAGSGSSGVVR